MILFLNEIFTLKKTQYVEKNNEEYCIKRLSLELVLLRVNQSSYYL